MPSPPACRRMRLYRRRTHLLAAQGGMTYTPPSIYEIRRNSNDFSEKFSCWEHEFFDISHGENTEAQKGHRAAPDFSILAAWRHQGKVASKIESYQKMKRYRENQEAAGNQATAEKPGGFGKAKGGGGTLLGPPSAFTDWVPPPPLQKERCAISRSLAAKGLRRQGATPPRGCAAKGFYRLRGALRKGGIRPGASCREPERLRPERPRS